jgi:hypothetical protein
MTNIDSLGISEDQIKSVDDVPEAAILADRQLFLNKWYRPVALAPVAVVAFLDFRVFPNSNNWFVVGTIMATLIWVIGVASYAFYLLVAFKCPKCHERFGLGEACKSCKLPRHSPGLESLNLSSR